MISRVCLTCGGCGCRIRLRLGLGVEPEQNFYFICSNCGIAIRGSQRADPNSAPRVDVRVEGAELLDEDEADFTVTLHPDFPAKADATEMHDPGGSPFLMQYQLLGDRFEEFNLRFNQFHGNFRTDLVSIRRWFDYYLGRNWSHFDAEGSRLLGDNWTAPDSEWKRHDSIHRAVDLIFAPLMLEPFYPEMRQSWGDKINAATSTHAEVLGAYLNAVAESTEVDDVQRAIFHCLEVYICNRGGILPGLAVEMYPAGLDSAVVDLRVFRDEFPALRDLYISAFETCHQTLEYVLAVSNIADRGDPDAFPGSRPANLAAFRRLPSAQKARAISQLPVWEHHWPQVLDRRLRNAIGHSSVRHDLASGTLVYRNRDAISYAEFVAKTLRIIHPILMSAAVIKLLKIGRLMHRVGS